MAFICNILRGVFSVRPPATTFRAQLSKPGSCALFYAVLCSIEPGEGQRWGIFVYCLRGGTTLGTVHVLSVLSKGRDNAGEYSWEGQRWGIFVYCLRGGTTLGTVRVLSEGGASMGNVHLLCEERDNAGNIHVLSVGRDDVKDCSCAKGKDSARDYSSAVCGEG
ncbi:hypothetical protein Bbelb_118570 [Branchiostoma belcheri]|nr:hypothetical protein Bbelb_118570 [Branchiostoma belcheri]